MSQAQQLADDFAPSARLYTDGHDMLAAEPGLHVLFSVVPAFVRSVGVEAAAALKGVHLFSEKPQTLDMPTANAIADAVAEGGVLSSVGFRERYRPLFRAARDFLADKETVHCSFRNFSGLPGAALDPSEHTRWSDDFSKNGGTMFDWGCHAVDYVRFMTGHDVTSAQAWYNHPPQYRSPLSASVNFQMTNGATMTSTFVASGPQPDREPWFVIHFVGGHLCVYGYDRVEVDGEVIYDATQDKNNAAPDDGYVKGVGYDPWYEQDRCFVEDVRDAIISALSAEQEHKKFKRRLVNDYADGLLSLGPVLAGWESARRGGEMIDVRQFCDVAALDLGSLPVASIAASED